jgi:hypothetical protein
MDELPSTEFRKVYPRLVKPTLVTVNGHVIGTWNPGASAEVREAMDRAVSGKAVNLEQASQVLYGTTQAQRDELLRKINKR